MIAQATTLTLGLASAALLLPDPLRTLGFRRPSQLALASPLLLSPALFVVISTLSLQIAMPWLLDEIARGKLHASREGAGELGRAVTQAPLLVTLLWGALFAAIVEELTFRGALWTALREGALRLLPNAQMAAGISSTLISAALFGFMHADMPGGVGIVRIVAATSLGLICGFARQLTGTLFAPILLHAAHNTLTIIVARQWLDDGSPPLIGVLPNRLLTLAGLGALGALALTIQSLAIPRQPHMR